MDLPIYTLGHVVDNAYVLPRGCRWFPPCIYREDAFTILKDSGFKEVVFEDTSQFSDRYMEYREHILLQTFERERPDLVQYQRFPELGAKETVAVKTRQIIRVNGDNHPIADMYYSSPKYLKCSVFQPVKLSLSPLPGEYDALVYNPHEPTSIVMGIREPVRGFKLWLEKCTTHPFQNIKFEPMAIMLRTAVNPMSFDEEHEALAKQVLAVMDPVHHCDMVWGEEELQFHMPELYNKACKLPLIPRS